MLSGVLGALAITLLSMKNKNWKRTYFETLLSHVMIWGQCLYFLAFALHNRVRTTDDIVVLDRLPNPGTWPSIDTMAISYQAALPGPSLSFPSYSIFAEGAIETWLPAKDPLALAIGIGLLVSCGMVFGLLSRHRELDHMIATFKRKEAAYEHALLDQKMRLLRTQINPHFLSNSMSVIGAYILEQTPHLAYQYLQGFSHLMRDVLEKATKPYLILKDEVHFLDKFLHNLSLQLPDRKLTWEFVIGPSLDPAEILVPTMILQPLVENAIEHGVRPKDGPGHVVISFAGLEGVLLCAVEDDGVGRSNKQEGTKSGHTSMALSITKERLQLMSTYQRPDYALNTIDLINEQGEASGTRVEIKLPLLRTEDIRI